MGTGPLVCDGEGMTAKVTDIISNTLAMEPLVLVTLPPPNGPELAKLLDSPCPIFLSFLVGLAVLLNVSSES